MIEVDYTTKVSTFHGAQAPKDWAKFGQIQQLDKNMYIPGSVKITCFPCELPIV